MPTPAASPEGTTPPPSVKTSDSPAAGSLSTASTASSSPVSELSSSPSSSQTRREQNVKSHKRVKRSQTPKTKRIVRTSRLDHVRDSNIAESEYWGFATLTAVGICFYMLSHPIVHYYEHGTFIDPSLAHDMFEDFFILMLVWAKFAIWSFSSYLLHVGFRRKLYSRVVVRVVQHTTQGIVVFFAIGSCLYNEWPILPSSFILILATIIFMKMHSYTETTMELYEEEGLPEADTDYPACINFRNYVHYLMSPVLVYETSYPRGGGFRLGYFLQKLLCLTAAMVCLYMVLTTYVMPITLESANSSLAYTFFRLLVPILIVDFLTFYILFESICNLLAEITNFGDREFYNDWWNSTTFDEYSRKWNRPVHEFLLRHLYLETLHKFHLSQRDAAIATYLFSALIHEMIIAVCLRSVRMYMFVMMMIQIPLISIGKYLKGTLWGNIFFWFGMMFGVPMLVSCYCREWAAVQNGVTHNFRHLHLI